jgi:hypothetical protein
MSYLGFESVPHRTTLSRCYKALYPLLQAFVQYVAQYVPTLDEPFANRQLYEDRSLFKAKGVVWHQRDRQAGRIPENLRNLTDATWSKGLSWLGLWLQPAFDLQRCRISQTSGRNALSKQACKPKRRSFCITCAQTPSRATTATLKPLAFGSG